jgi:hypothetical protein
MLNIRLELMHEFSYEESQPFSHNSQKRVRGYPGGSVSGPLG